MADNSKKNQNETSDAIRAIRRGTYDKDYSIRTAFASVDPNYKPAPTLKAKLTGN